jgi:hypothetical protein
VVPQAQAAPVVPRVQVVPVQVVPVQVVPVQALGPGLGRRRAPEVLGRLLRRRCRGRTPV